MKKRAQYHDNITLPLSYSLSRILFCTNCKAKAAYIFHKHSSRWISSYMMLKKTQLPLIREFAKALGLYQHSIKTSSIMRGCE